VRSLNQLETLLHADSIAENSLFENLDPLQLDPPQVDLPEAPNRFGGSLLDAIPLAQRLGTRLEQPRSQSSPSPEI